MKRFKRTRCASWLLAYIREEFAPYQLVQVMRLEDGHCEGTASLEDVQCELTAKYWCTGRNAGMQKINTS